MLFLCGTSHPIPQTPRSETRDTAGATHRLDQLAFTGTTERLNPKSYAYCADTPCDYSAPPLNVAVREWVLLLLSCEVQSKVLSLATAPLLTVQSFGLQTYKKRCLPLAEKAR